MIDNLEYRISGALTHVSATFHRYPIASNAAAAAYTGVRTQFVRNKIEKLNYASTHSPETYSICVNIEPFRTRTK